MSEEIEYVLLNKKECFVYNVPPATTASGYKAADWANCIWKGRLQVCAKGDILVVKLLDPSTGAIFAACPVPPTSAIDRVIERTVDSSRYFVLTMSDKTGRKAYLGMGFDDRNDAFDFNAALQDFRRQSVPEVIQPVHVKPPVDLSLKAGQKINVQIKALKPPTETKSSFLGNSLPAPPVSKSRHFAEDDLLDNKEVSSPQPPSSSVPSLLD